MIVNKDTRKLTLEAQNDSDEATLEGMYQAWKKYEQIKIENIVLKEIRR